MAGAFSFGGFVVIVFVVDKDVNISEPDEVAERDEAAETEPVLEPPFSQEDEHEANAMRVWSEASKLFSGMRYGSSNPVDAWFQSRRQFGDAVTSSKKLRYWKKLKTLTDTLNDAELEYIRLLSHQRFEFSAAIFRMNAITSVTLPVTAAVVANQLYPGIVQTFIAESTVITALGILTLLIIVAVGFGNVFKARELRMALELEVARRRLRRGEVNSASEAGTSEFDLDPPIT